MTRKRTIEEATACHSESVVDDSTGRPSGVIVACEPRTLPRIRMELNAQVSTLDPNGDASYTLASAKTLDVADGGLGLVVDEVICVDQRVVIEIELAGGQSTERTGRVAWTSEDPTGACFIGIQFDAIVTGFAEQATKPITDAND